MGRKVFAAGGVALALALAALGGPHRAEACATAPPVGAWVSVARESAIVVWDETAKREHFIRKASFRSTAKDFGFLVPTPTRPELAEVDDALFEQLAVSTRPRVETRVERSGLTVGLLTFATFARSAPATVSAAPVRVLDEATVAGYDAVVLEADDPKALATWLTEHGYEARPALASWLAPYVARRWKITAFKVAGTGAPSATWGTKAVRMSFDAERPYFPYREPIEPRDPSAAAVDAGRELLVYVVAPRRVGATIGATGAFPGSIPFAKHLGAELPPELARLAGVGDPFVTVVVDPSSPRPGTDELFFDPAASQSEVEPAPVVQIVRESYVVPLEGVVLVVGFGAWLAVVVRRGRRERA